MSEERLALQLEQFGKALAALKLALDQTEDEFIRDSIIKRFELCFETARKAIRQWLVEEEEITYSATKKEVMEAAFRVGLLDAPEVWNKVVEARNDTAHEYNEQAAALVIAFVRTQAFAALSHLLNRLSERR